MAIDENVGQEDTLSASDKQLLLMKIQTLCILAEQCHKTAKFSDSSSGWWRRAENYANKACESMAQYAHSEEVENRIKDATREKKNKEQAMQESCEMTRMAIAAGYGYGEE